MELRRFIISVITKYNGAGVKEADDDLEKLRRSSKHASGATDELDRTLGEMGKAAARAAVQERQLAKETERAAKAAEKAAATRAKAAQRAEADFLKTVASAAASFEKEDAVGERSAAKAGATAERRADAEAKAAARSASARERSAERAAVAEKRAAERAVSAKERAGQRSVNAEKRASQQAAAARERGYRITADIDRRTYEKRKAAAAKAAVDETAASEKARSGRREAAGTLGGFAGTAGKAALIGAAGIVATGAAVIKVGTDFETLRARLKTVEGSADGAAKAFGVIQDFTKKTPFELDEVTTAYLRLKNIGLDASTESLTAFGNIAAAMGKPIVEFVEAVADASTGEFERLKEFGIKASSQGDKVAFTFAGITTTVGKNSQEIEAYLKNLGETKFGTAMSDQMGTSAGMISNLKDGFKTFLDTVSQMGVLDAFKGLLGDVSEKFGDGEPLAKMLADALVRVIEAIRGAVQATTEEDVAGAFETFKDAALALATAINVVSDALRIIIDLSGGFEGAVVNMTLVTVGIVAAFQGPAGLVVAAAAAGAAIGTLLNRFGASDRLADFLGDITGLNAELAKLDKLNGGGKGKRGAPTPSGGAVEEDVTYDLGQAAYDAAKKKALDRGISEESAEYFAQRELEHVRSAADVEEGGKVLVNLQGAADLASGKGIGENDKVRAAAEEALGLNDLTAAAQGRAEETAAKAKPKGGGKGKKPAKDTFFQFEEEVKKAAEKQAEEFAQQELERLIAGGSDPDQAVALARQAGKTRAKELEERFRQAGRIFDGASKNILDMLGLRGPGSVLEGRPPPQTLLITIAPVINIGENMTITIHGAGSKDEADLLTNAANQARDAFVAKFEDVAGLVDAMFGLQGKRLLESHGGGRSIPGVQ